MQYQVLVKNGNQTGFIASVIGLPDCRAEGRTEEEAIARVKAALANLLSQSKVVTIEIETGRPVESHLLKPAGRFKDRLTDDELLAEIAKHRREIRSEDLTRPAPAENPWLATAGIFADDSTWDDFIAKLEDYRREANAEEPTE